MVERRAENSEVAGSNPAGSTRVSWFATFGERGSTWVPATSSPPLPRAPEMAWAGPVCKTGVADRWGFESLLWDHHHLPL
jgi:hypothetical protein